MKAKHTGKEEAKITAKARRKSVRLAIIGTGGMASRHAEMFSAIPGCELVAACDLQEGRLRDFASRFAISKTETEYRKILSDPKIDAVSIVVPDAFHAPIALDAIRANKHLLCEKPLALNANDAKKMERAASGAGVVNMVNLSYRDWPAIQAVAAVVQSGGIGDLRHVEASYLQAWLASKAWGDWRTSPQWLWRLSTAHGSNGVLGDIGVHIVDFAMFPCGPIRSVYCQMKTFPKAKGNRIGEYRLDANDSAIITATFANGAIGTIQATRWSPGNANRLLLRISGALGCVEIDSERSTTSYRICAGKNLDTNSWETIETPPTPTNYQRFIQSVLGGKNDAPSFRQGAEAQKVLDASLLSHSQSRPVSISRPV